MYNILGSSEWGFSFYLNLPSLLLYLFMCLFNGENASLPFLFTGKGTFVTLQYESLTVDEVNTGQGINQGDKFELLKCSMCFSPLTRRSI